MMHVECRSLCLSIAQVRPRCGVALEMPPMPPPSAERWSPATARTHRLRSVQVPKKNIGIGGIWSRGIHSEREFTSILQILLV